MDVMAEVVKELNCQLDNCKRFIQNFAANHPESALAEVLELKRRQLKKYIKENKKFPLCVAIAKAALKREPLRTNPKFVMESLYNCSFEYDQYKAVGENDGVLITLRSLFNILGMTANAKECTVWLYSAE